MRVSFTRSRSPLPPPQAVNGNDAPPPFRTASPMPPRIKQGINYQHILPPAFHFSFRTPFSEKIRRFYIDSSKACEATLLLGSMVFAAKCLSEHKSEIWTSIGGLSLLVQRSQGSITYSFSVHRPSFFDHRCFYLNHDEQKSISSLPSRYSISFGPISHPAP